MVSFLGIRSLIFSVSYWVSFLGIMCGVGKKCLLGFCILSDSHSYNASVGCFAILCFSDSHPGLQVLGDLKEKNVRC